MFAACGDESSASTICYSLSHGVTGTQEGNTFIFTCIIIHIISVCFGLVLRCLMTPGLSKDIRYHV